MLNELIVTHTDDPTITATLKRPSRDAFAAWWDAIVEHRGALTYEANLNLVVACRAHPDPVEFAALLAEEWSGLPSNEIANALSALAGFFGVGYFNAEQNIGERVDVRALMGNVLHYPPDEQKKALDRAAHHRAAMLECGITEGQLSLWFGVRNPHITRLAIALPWGGYHVARTPSAAERAHASDVHNDTSDGGGPFEAKASVALSCSLWPDRERISAMGTDRPGALARLGALIESLGGGYRVALGK